VYSYQPLAERNIKIFKNYGARNRVDGSYLFRPCRSDGEAGGYPGSKWRGAKRGCRGVPILFL